MSKKAMAYCNIVTYLGDKHPEFAEAVRLHCAEHLMRKRKSGVTLLMPVKGSKVYNEIVSSARTDDVDKKKKGSSLLVQHILPFELKSPAAFKATSPLHNVLRREVAVASANSSEVKLANGAVIKPVDDFKDASDVGNFSVYSIADPGIDVDAKIVERPKREPRKRGETKKPATTGGYDPGQLYAKSLRFRIATFVENVFAQDNLQEDVLGSIDVPKFGSADTAETITSHKRNIYVEKVLSLVSCLKKCGEDKVLKCIVPLISYQEIDFYLIIEPHREMSESDYLVPTHCIEKWWKEQPAFNMLEAIKIVDEVMESGGSKVLSSAGRKEVLESVENARMEIEESADAQFSAIVEAYKKCDCSVYPGKLAERYAANKYTKIVEDEARYTCYKVFHEIWKGYFDLSKYQMIVGAIARYFHEPASEKRLRLLSDFNSDMKQTEVTQFLQSTMFMFTPLSRDESSKAKYIYPNQYGKVDIEKSDHIWNMIGERAADAEAMAGQFSATMADSALKSKLKGDLEKLLSEKPGKNTQEALIKIIKELESN